MVRAMIEPDEDYEKRSEAARGGLHKEHVAALIRLATVEQERGQSAEAERLLAEAIGIAEKHLDADDPSLGVALSQLSRLHIRRADFTGAEPLLARLLQIARKKGDSHPDVATASHLAARPSQPFVDRPRSRRQIGRASCRERV